MANSPTNGISDFISRVKANGLARSNRFGVVVSLPPMLTNASITEEMYLFCESAQLPGMNMSTTQARTFGEYREMPYEKLFDPVSLTFLNDSGLAIKSFWETWCGNIQDPVTREFRYYNEYTANIDIYVYDVANNAKYQVTLYEAYPKTIASADLNQGSREVLKTTVTIQYRYFRSTLIEGTDLAAQLTESGNQEFFTSSFSDFQNQFTEAKTLFENPIQTINARDMLAGKGRALSRLGNLFG
jgi:hypothetical protein